MSYFSSSFFSTARIIAVLFFFIFALVGYRSASADYDQLDYATNESPPTSKSIYQQLGTGLEGSLTSIDIKCRVNATGAVDYMSLWRTDDDNFSTNKVRFFWYSDDACTVKESTNVTANVFYNFEFDLTSSYFKLNGSGTCTPVSSWAFDVDKYYYISQYLWDWGDLAYGSNTDLYAGGEAMYVEGGTMTTSAVIDDMFFSIGSSGSASEDSGYIEINSPSSSEVFYKLDEDFQIDIDYWNYVESSVPYDTLRWTIFSTVSGSAVLFDSVLIDDDNVEEEKNIVIEYPLYLNTDSYEIVFRLYNSSTYAESSEESQYFTLVLGEEEENSFGHDWQIQKYGEFIHYPPYMILAPATDVVIPVTHFHPFDIEIDIDDYFYAECTTVACTAFNNVYVKDVDFTFEDVSMMAVNYLELSVEPVVDTVTKFYIIGYMPDDIVSSLRFIIKGDITDGAESSSDVASGLNVCGDHSSWLDPLTIPSFVCQLIVPDPDNIKLIFSDFYNFLMNKIPAIGQMNNSLSVGMVHSLENAETTAPVIETGEYRGVSGKLADFSILDDYILIFRNFISISIWVVTLTFVMFKIKTLFITNEVSLGTGKER